jgi:hypothetical protein
MELRVLKALTGLVPRVAKDGKDLDLMEFRGPKGMLG